MTIRVREALEIALRLQWPDAQVVTAPDREAELRTSNGPEYIQTERGHGYRFVRPSERGAGRTTTSTA